MEVPQTSTAGRRQFEKTAVEKLVAQGVARHVAIAFVTIGIPRSGRYERVKDVVCKMKFQKFFIEKTPADFKDPSRVGAYVPHVVSTKRPRFHAQFAMSDIEAAKLQAEFPELDVVARGSVYNQHAYFANKRYAETELLIMEVYRHAAKHHLDPLSVVDLGGNAGWHKKRNRPEVHCDNPVLSVRDTMRYKVREIYSGEDPRDACRRTFGSCEHQADYGIGVHSTYDLTPKSIAGAMIRRKMKAFFGVINLTPGVEFRREGQVRTDGMVLTVCRPPRAAPYVKYTFDHDPSLEYVHRITVLKRYMEVSKRYDFFDALGGVKSFLYSITSVRGSALYFKIEECSDLTPSSYAVWTPPVRRLYYLTLDFAGVDRLEVDCELFDRLVLQAAGARNFADYDILSLFRYAKSLRQRVSINGIVLSSGYVQRPDEVVAMVMAAYCVAAAYRVESGEYFKAATSQIMDFRAQGFFRDLYRITSKLVTTVLMALPAALYSLSGIPELSDHIRRWVAKGASVHVVVDKPHADRGRPFQPDCLRLHRPHVPEKPSTGFTPLRPGGFAAPLTPTFASFKSERMCFMTRGVPAMEAVEEPGEGGQNFTVTGLPDLTSQYPVTSEEYRDAIYLRALGILLPLPRIVRRPLVMLNGDRVYRFAEDSVDAAAVDIGRADMDFVAEPKVYAVCRGVGRRAAVLTPPASYKRGTCLRFVLFYDDMFSPEEYRRMKSADNAPQAVSGPEFSELPKESPVDEVHVVDNMVFELATEGAVEPAGAGDEWEVPEVPDPRPVYPKVVRFSDEVARERFEQDMLKYDLPYMSGALPVPTSEPSTGGHHSPSDSVDSASMPPGAEESLFDDDEGASSLEGETRSGGARQPTVESVDSDEVVPGRKAMEELLRLCEAERQVALATTRSVMDLAISVARGDAPRSRFGAVAQAHPGDVTLVHVKDDGSWIDYLTGQKVEHMAVSDGDEVYERGHSEIKPGWYVTSDVMRVYVGGAIAATVRSVIDDPYMCDVVNMDGVAGSGKTYQITHSARVGDVVLCETRGALSVTARELKKLVPGWEGHAYTVDSFLRNRQVDSCATLWVDESLRLHGAKVFACIKRLKPSRVYCYGDSKQIAVLPFVPGFDFEYHVFPFTSTEVNNVSWRCPADVCMALSVPSYYGRHITTHNPILRSVEGPVVFNSSMFDGKPADVPLLVYTIACRDDLRKQGVKNVWTIGESQGETYDVTMVFRESDLNKALYYSPEQTLVALTRHRRAMTYITAAAVTDDSLIARVIRYIREKSNELLLSSHQCDGVIPVASYAHYRAVMAAARSYSRPGTPSVAGTGSAWDDVGSSVGDVGSAVQSVVGDWAEYMDEAGGLAATGTGSAHPVGW